MNEQAKRLGAQIRAAREALGMTQQELSDAVGRGGGLRTIQALEAGETMPWPRTLLKIRTALNMPGDEQETRAGWGDEAQIVVGVIGELLTGMSVEERAAFRRRIIEIVVQGQRPQKDWPEDVELIVDMLGAFLSRSD